MTPVRTRFAPSPTGFMHVGSARTALYAWLYARQHEGAFILRIEDTDKAREMEGAIGHIMESLKWLGIQWDEGLDIGGAHGPYIQSDRLEIYKKYAQMLVAAGCAYPEPFSEEEIEQLRKEAEGTGKPFLIREHRPEKLEEWDGARTLRFKVPLIKRYEWKDLIMGDLSAGEEALDDFILIKADGYPTYNFAHVVDDIEMHITHVMRGQEFISSTPKFLSLYDALDTAPPHFATIPPILGEGGNKKLSKRDGAKDILDYREEGYLPEAFVNFLALLGWHPHGNEEVLSMDDLLREFDIERVQRGGAQFDEQKLLHINREWMRKLSDEEYVAKGELVAPDAARLRRAVHLLKERAHTFQEAREMLAGELAHLFAAPSLSRDELTSKGPSTNEHLAAFLTLIEALDEDATPEAIKEALMPYADALPKENGGRGAALWPLRYALSGEERSPDPFTLIFILGKEESCARIKAAQAILQSR